MGAGTAGLIAHPCPQLENPPDPDPAPKSGVHGETDPEIGIVIIVTVIIILQRRRRRIDIGNAQVDRGAQGEARVIQVPAHVTEIVVKDKNSEKSKYHPILKIQSYLRNLKTC